MALSKEQQAAIQSLADADENIEPIDVVEEARDPSSPLHDEFEWDDSKAAAAHRLEVARNLIRSFRFEVVTEHITYSAPAYVIDPERPPKSKRYRPLVSIARDREVAQRVLVDEMQRVENAIRRAEAVAAVLNLTNEVRLMLRKAIAIRESIERGRAGARRPPGRRPAGKRARAKGRRSA